MRSTMRALPALVTLVALSGCTVAEGDPRSLGRYEVTMTQTESCGEDVLIEAPAEQVMTVFLRRPSTGSLLWMEREGTFGLTIDDDGTFRGTYRRTATFGEDGACRLSRDDEVEGDFGVAGPEGAETFTGTMRNVFAALDDAECASAMEAPVPLADGLPCALAYDLEAERID